MGRGGADTAYVGVAVGLTNPERYTHLFDGVALAFDSLNRIRPEGAPPLALRRAPSAADSPVKIATAFRDDPSIVAVIGHTESDATIVGRAGLRRPRPWREGPRPRRHAQRARTR